MDANCVALSEGQRMGLNVVFFTNIVLAKGREHVSVRK